MVSRSTNKSRFNLFFHLSCGVSGFSHGVFSSFWDFSSREFVWRLAQGYPFVSLSPFRSGIPKTYMFVPLWELRFANLIML